MRIRRVTLTLPARMKGTAAHDARAIGEALGRALHDSGGETTSITLEGHGQSGSVLAVRVAAAGPRGGQHGR